VAADEYTLPPADPCYSTLEAYKHYTADAIEDAYRAVYYGQYGARIEQWQQCCPELQQRVQKLRPDKLDIEALKTVEIPEAIVTRDSPCFQHLYDLEMPADQQSRGKAWFKHREAFSRSYWEKQYAGLADELHACCVNQFNHCLQAAQEQFAR
jgi:hypothetical protein